MTSRATRSTCQPCTARPAASASRTKAMARSRAAATIAKIPPAPACRAELLQNPLLEVVFGQAGFAGAGGGCRASEGSLNRFVNHATGFEVRTILRRAPAGLEALHQVGGACDLASLRAHQLDGSGVHHRDVRNGVARRILHG